jgi:hypothetical protein
MSGGIMAKERCHIIGEDVSVIADVQGVATNVLCRYFTRGTYGCKHKTRNTEDGTIKGIAKVLVDNIVDSRMTYCEFTGPRKSFF